LGNFAIAASYKLALARISLKQTLKKVSTSGLENFAIVALPTIVKAFHKKIEECLGERRRERKKTRATAIKIF